jgi:uncharacterized protein DUF2510
MVLGALIGVPGGLVATLHTIGAASGGPHIEVPGRSIVHLSAGPYLLYEETGSSHGFAGFSVSHNRGTSIAPADLEVTAPDGHRLAVREPGDTQTLTLGSTIYTGAVRFDAPTDGDYELRATSSTATSAIVGRPLTSALGEVTGWFVVGAVGGAVFLAGLVLFTVVSIRRRRVESRALLAVAPPGWYVDPGDASRWRYWDGSTWTGYVS